MIRRKIYSRFLKLCSGVTTAAPWSRHEGVAECRRLDISAPKVIEKLREEFTTSDLAKSRLFEFDSKKTLDIASFSQGIPQRFVPLRTGSGARPFDLLTEYGMIGGELPIYAALYDFRIQTALLEFPCLLVAFSLPDLSALSAVGLPVALAAGLESFTPKSFEEFRAALCGSPLSSLPTPHQLILVGWEPSSLRNYRPQQLEAVVDNLKACPPMGQNSAEIMIWRPQASSIASFGRCLLTGSREDVVQLIMKSLDEEMEPLDDPSSRERSKRTLADATVALRQVLTRSSGTPIKRRKRLRAFNKQLEREIINPLAAIAAAESGPEEKSRLIELMAYSRFLPLALIRLSAGLDRDLEDNGVFGDGRIPELGQVMTALQARAKLLKGK